ncbi:hypothetical protein RFI_10144 [Reticulomyxa filosa]|uniref:Uncharacterized protein n=1 Tax=Reticulomyxa filosa TaxID=46433 RepID=X6NMS5_RETFI|nr:hypothetical protein RFI_10144 [Reticulomyxa filosa]|eukprot:ETO26984.1 hypothetical protein RFI_10144 [Reticulomyxa filosa]
MMIFIFLKKMLEQIVERPFSCTPTSDLCGQFYTSTAWSDATNGEEGGFCQLQNCRALCEVQLEERSSFPNDIPHWFQKNEGQWYPYEVDTEYNETVRFDTGTSCNEYNHGLREHFHNIPRGKCLAGFAYSSGEDACYLSSYQYSGCYVDRAFPPNFPPDSNQDKCYGSNDTCGDGWVGTCDDVCENSYCSPARQPNYETLMRLTHYVCNVNGEWISFADFESSLTDDSNNPSFVFDGTNVTKFQCEIPTSSITQQGQQDVSNANAGTADIQNGGAAQVGTGDTQTGGTSTGTGTGTGTSTGGQASSGDTQSGGSSQTGTGNTFGGSGGSSSNSSSKMSQVLIWNGILILAMLLVLAFARFAYTRCYSKQYIKKRLSDPDVVPLLA